MYKSKQHGLYYLFDLHFYGLVPMGIRLGSKPNAAIRKHAFKENGLLLRHTVLIPKGTEVKSSEMLLHNKRHSM